VDPVVHTLLRRRLSSLDRAPARLIEEACGPPRGSAATLPVWLRSIEVEGFRGIGPPATLPLSPEPGLTVVVGSNGSGKSSFAEALELLMTGAVKRWTKRPKAWTDAWQCLHHDGPTRLAADLETGGGVITLNREWPRGARYDGMPAAEHDWSGALVSFRPFLSYAELATMFDTLTSLYEALSPVLGLGDIDDVLRRLADERLVLERREKAAKAFGSGLRARLDPADSRQAAVLAALRRRDLDAVAAVLPAPDDPVLGALRRMALLVLPDDEEVRDAASVNTGRLLHLALEHWSGDECPVCGTPGVLDDEWAARVEAFGEPRELLDAAARAVAREAGIDTADLGAAVAELRELRQRAEEELERSDGVWRERAGEIAGWLAEARAAAADAPRLRALKVAEAWLKAVAADLRADRFAPIAERAIENWRELRQGSSVDLCEIRLRKVGRNGRADFGVSAEGERANALGVMSQGELLALSVSVFLPRVALDESPFRFAIIDDPVQAMDAATVEGLARVLRRAAMTRQLVVFTHDDRLPDAIRRQEIDATILQVERHARSSVTVPQR
jgi:energy-coupling factor transporter ATP-binding protein EcfA2